MENNDSKNFVRIMTIFTSFIIILASYFYITTPSADKKKYEEKNTDIVLEIGGDFELINFNGERESSKKYSNQYKLIYFGFTYCPDICPLAMSTISGAIDILDKYNMDIVPIFITIDPHRDTPEVLKPYLGHFNKKIIGYTGSEDEIKKVSDLFKVYAAKVIRPDAPEEDYLMDHSSFIYLLSPDAKYLKHFSSSDSSEEIANGISKIIRERRLNN